MPTLIDPRRFRALVPARSVPAAGRLTRPPKAASPRLQTATSRDPAISHALTLARELYSTSRVALLCHFCATSLLSRPLCAPGAPLTGPIPANFKQLDTLPLPLILLEESLVHSWHLY